MHVPEDVRLISILLQIKQRALVLLDVLFRRHVKTRYETKEVRSYFLVNLYYS